MKRWFLFSLGILLLSSLVVLREWLIKKEVESLQTELSQSLAQSLEAADSFERLEELSRSYFVFDRYLEPIINVSQRMIWPPLRQSYLNQWEARVHRNIEDKKYLRLVEIRDQIQDEISTIRAKSEPSKERMMEVMKHSLLLDSEAARREQLRAEVDAIEDQLKKMDEKLFGDIKKLGVERLKALQIKIRSLDDKAFRAYLSSNAFIEEVHKPVVHQIMEISTSKLRKDLWDEYTRALTRILSGKSRKIAKAQAAAIAKLDKEKVPVQSLAELLREEYEKDDVSYIPLPETNPANAN